MNIGLSVGSLVVSAALAVADGQDSASRLLELSLQAHDYCEQISMDVDSEIDSIAETKDEISRKQTVRTAFLRKGRFLRVEGDHRYHGGLEGESFHFREIINENVHMYTRYKLNSEKKPTSGIGSPDVKNGLALALEAQWSSGAMDGYLQGTSGVRIAALMKGAADLRLRDAPEDVDGIHCRVLEASTSCGKAVLWLSPAHGYLIKKVTLQKGLDDVYEEGKTLRYMNENAFLPGNAIQEWSATLVNMTYAELDGRSVPTEGHVTISSLRANGAFEAKYFHRRSGVRLNPEVDAGSFRTDLPENSPVHNTDDPDSGVRYAWNGEKIVPAAADFTDGAEQPTGRLRLLLIGILAIAGAVFIFLGLRYLLRRRSSP